MPVVRQAFVLIRNAGIENLSVKLGRQLVVFGNHRLFGHFDWANTGFSQDAATVQYASKIWNFIGGWGRPSDKNFAFAGANSSVFGVAPPGVNTQVSNANTVASNAADFFRGQAEAVNHPDVKALFLRLAEWEDTHYSIIQAELDAIHDTGFWFDIPEFRMDGKF